MIAATVKPDGTYRLHVAPGWNLVYLLTGEGGRAYVQVTDGEEVRFDLRTDMRIDGEEENDADLKLSRELHKEVKSPIP